MKRYLLTSIFLFSVVALAIAQNIPSSIDDILKSIEKNNKELQAEKYAAKAEKLENKTKNNLSDPVLNYSSFYSNAAEGGHGTEFIATQGFDFPTQYITRNKQIKLQNSAIEMQHKVSRRDILFQAKDLCLDLILLNQENELMTTRSKNADRLLQLYEEKMQKGDANIIDVNKIKIERMNLFTEMTKNKSAHRVALQELLAMNGYMPLEFSETQYPYVTEINDMNVLRDKYIPSELEIHSANAQVLAAEKQISVEKQGWLPKLEVGYRRNTSSVDSENGFVLGGSIPIFENHKKVGASKAMALSAKLRKESISQKAESNLMGLFSEMRQLKMALNNYDMSLLKESLDLLNKSLGLGQISLIDYFLESEDVYRNMQAYMQLENQYQKIMAEIYKNDL